MVKQSSVRLWGYLGRRLGFCVPWETHAYAGQAVDTIQRFKKRTVNCRKWTVLKVRPCFPARRARGQCRARNAGIPGGVTPYSCQVKVTPGRISVCTVTSLGHSREQRGQSSQGAWFCPSGDRGHWQFCGGKEKGTVWHQELSLLCVLCVHTRLSSLNL